MIDSLIYTNSLMSDILGMDLSCRASLKMVWTMTPKKLVSKVGVQMMLVAEAMLYACGKKI